MMSFYRKHIVVKLSSLILYTLTLIKYTQSQGYSWHQYENGVFDPAFTSSVEVDPPFGTCGHPDWTNNTYYNVSRGIAEHNCTWECVPERSFQGELIPVEIPVIDGSLDDIGQFWAPDCIWPNQESVINKRRKRQTNRHCVVFYEDQESFFRETHTLEINPSNSDMKEGVIFDVFDYDAGPFNSKGPNLRITGNSLKLSMAGLIKTYENAVRSNSWSTIAVQVYDDRSSHQDGRLSNELFVNGEYLEPTLTEHIEPEFPFEPQRKKRSSGGAGNQIISFGVLSAEEFSGTGDGRNEIIDIPQCRAIKYNAVVRPVGAGSQGEISAMYFDRDSETSIYNCNYNEDHLTLFTCALLTPALGEFDQAFGPCRAFCEEIVNACGQNLPFPQQVNCTNFPERNCINTDYVPYSGIYEGEIRNYKYFDEILTERQIKYLATGNFPRANPHSECLCPPHYPSISDNPNYCVLSMYGHHPEYSASYLYNYDRITELKSRYSGENLHVPQFAVDKFGGHYTTWVSAPGLEEVALSFIFEEDVQVMGVTFTLSTPFPHLLENDPGTTGTYEMEIALLNGDTWRTAYRLDRFCQEMGSGDQRTFFAEEVVCSAPHQNYFSPYDNTLDFLKGKEAFYNGSDMAVELVSFLNARGLRIKFNAFPEQGVNEEAFELNIVQRVHFVNNVEVHARKYEGRVGTCECYAEGTDLSRECDHNTGQCPCRDDIGDPSEAGLKCEPYVTGILPSFGPVAGETRLLIFGGYFGQFPSNEAARNHIHVTFGDTGLSCLRLSATQTAIECFTPHLNLTADPSLERFINNTVQVRIQLSINNSSFSIVHEDVTFTYMPDPIIESVSPRDSIIRGGILQTVTGQNINSVYAPQMVITLIADDREYEQDEKTLCTVISSTEMHCPAPEIDPNDLGRWGRRRRNADVESPHLPLMLDAEEVENDANELNARIKRQTQITTAINRDELQFYIGFELDGVETYTNLSEALNYTEGIIYIHENPDVEEWDPETQIFRPNDGDEMVDINGNHMNFGAKDIDYAIQIGKDGECEVVELNTNRLTCRPPSKSPKHDSSSKSGAHRVLLEVGNLKYHVGYLQYYETLWDDPKVRAAVISVAVIVGVILLTILIVCLVLKRLYGDPIAHIRGRLKYKAATQDSNSYEERPRLLMDMLDSDLKVKITECLIEPHTRMKLGHEVGKGNFGKVYSGLLAMPDQANPTDCAIKTLKDDSDNVKELREFLEEATIMKDFKHPNVLSLYGVVIVQNRPHVLLPFMAYGDLRGYVANPRNNFSVGELLDYGLQISKGMAYLSGLKFVHRDLAARNCMVDEKKMVKIADFGLARDIYEKDYYAVEDRRRPMPIKWMAPECLDTFKFDSRSDVWSYGVTLWEVMMRGRKPYAGVDNLDIKRFLQRGGRLDKPAFCPDAVYDLMMACWHFEPSERPSFHQLADNLINILDEANQLETSPQQNVGQPSNQHEYLEMVRMSQPGYVPLQTDVPADENSASAENNNQLESKPASERYTREPGAMGKDYNDPYLKPFTDLPDEQKVKDDVEGYEGVRRPSQDKSRYQILSGGDVNECQMPKEPAPPMPMSASPPEGYLAPVQMRDRQVPVSTSPPGGDGYLPPTQVSVNVDDATANYTNL